MSEIIDHPTRAPALSAAPSAPIVDSDRSTATGRGPLRFLPGFLVLFALAGLAYWGHETGWQVPRFSELIGRAGEHANDWCDAHAVPESLCVECNSDLLPRPASHGWCKVHGVHECPLEHPEVAQLAVPPTITQQDLDRARQALEFAIRPANSPKCKLHARRIQLASDDAVRRAGIKVDAAWQQPVVEAVMAPGEITYDPTRVAQLAAPVTGKASLVFAQVGQSVRKGDVLALVDSLDVGRAKGELLKAIATFDVRSKVLERQRKLFQEGAGSQARLTEAEAEVGEAEIRLVAAQQALVNLGLPVAVEKLKGLTPTELGRRIQLLGLPDSIARDLDPATTSANLVPVIAPLDGVVVARKVGAGEQAEPGKVLFVVADPRKVWLNLQVRQEDAKRLKARDPVSGSTGQTVKFLAGGAEREVTGEVVWVSTAIDEKTRTVPVRVDLPNPDGQLRAGTFGTGRIILREEKRAVVVPSEAIQWEGDCHVVFVRDKNFEAPGSLKVFHTRVVRPGAHDGNVTEIIAGVLPGELVVTQGSGIFRSELLKNSLGEG
jgi:cobalt-zinc-cadmium efflux system membrane fusion protein